MLEPRTAEVIAVGDELTSGQRLNTNSQWLAERLGRLGVRTAYHTSVGDDLAENVEVFRVAASRAGLVVCTGGLGPTADDLTREALAAAFDAPLELRDEAMRHIESMFARRKRPMPPRNRTQAMFPAGSRMIDNRDGTAPGIDFTVSGSVRGGGDCRIFALPGVPAEMVDMFESVVEPRLMAECGLGRERWFYRNIRLFGLGESDAEAMVPDLIARQRQPLVGITVSKATINLRIATLAADAAEAEARVAATVDEIRRQLGEYVFGEGEDEPWDAAVRRLAAAGKTLAIAEYGVAGVLGPPMTLAAADAGDSYRRVVAAAWAPARGDLDLERCHAVADLTLVAGPYPAPAERGDAPEFTAELFERGRPVASQTVAVGGHPEIVLPRLAKYAAMTAFRYLAPV